MGLPLRDEEFHTYGDYRHWGDERRYELIDGVAYAMSPSPTRHHQEVTGEIYYQARQGLDPESECRIMIAPLDVRLPRGDEADDQIDTVLQPDVLAVCDPDKLDDRGVRGAPDWVVEVVSPSTASHDHIHKRRVYERHGVTELWLVHPTDRLLTIYWLEGEEYGKPEVVELAGETEVRALPGVRIAWDALVERLPPQDP
ncbi:Uma2 family endonuclease [Guyparkeria sp.]|uniref:Uma2 family endonuclease n=1 Tax=Guyparkeria sp. TaxID=2035736 RepID=UPI0039709D17